MDFMADNMVMKIIGEIIKGKGELKTDKEIWYQMTKCLIRNGDLGFILNSIETINVEVSDEQWLEHKYPNGFFNEDKEPRKIISKTNNKLKNLINSKVKITDIAKGYSLDTDKRGRTTCPFHNDSDPSLVLDDLKNVFYCFGCHAKGDLITFIRKMEELKEGNGNKRGSC